MVQTFLCVPRNASLLFSLISPLFRFIVRADIIVVDQGKSIFYFGFVFEIDQLR